MRTHGECESELYHIWEGIKARCYNPKHPGYYKYGAIGIGLCQDWHLYTNFKNYITTVLGERPSKNHSIDRIDGSKGYEPGNLRWATAKEQQRNREINVRISYKGRTLCLAEWAEITGYSHSNLLYRVNAGWSPDKIIETPIRPRRKSIMKEAQSNGQNHSLPQTS